MSNERIELLVSKAFKIAEEFEHEYVTLEHLLCVLFEDENIINLVVEVGGDPLAIADHSYAYCGNELEQIKIASSERGPRKTMALERMFNRAFTQSMFNGRQFVTPVDLLLSILAEKNSYAVTICNGCGLTREGMLQYITDNSQVTEQQNQRHKADQVLSKYTINLNKEAKKSNLDNLIGREVEVESLVQTLARRKKNNVVLVGDADRKSVV